MVTNVNTNMKLKLQFPQACGKLQLNCGKLQLIRVKQKEQTWTIENQLWTTVVIEWNNKRELVLNEMKLKWTTAVLQKEQTSVNLCNHKWTTAVLQVKQLTWTDVKHLWTTVLSLLIFFVWPPLRVQRVFNTSKIL